MEDRDSATLARDLQDVARGEFIAAVLHGTL